jgi:glycosyltransferase involved in cell wall biosynthesis
MRPAGPLVSILLPAFDAEATLEACLASVARQSFSRWECVVVDDGSADATAAVAARRAARDPRFRVVRRRHGGIVSALNAGLAHCRGEIVARMDADDLMQRRRLELQVAALESHPEWAGVGAHVRLFPRRALGPGYRDYEAWLNAVDSPDAVRREAWVECPLAHPTLAIRRPVLARLGYRERGWPEDYDLVLRLLGEGHDLGVVPRRLLAWRHAAGRLSRVDPAYAPDRFAACKARFLAATFLAGAPRYLLWGYGSTGRSLRRELAALGRRPSHVIDLHPGRVGQRVEDAPVVPPREIGRLPRLPLVVSVAGAGPRGAIRRHLATLGLTELRDFVCAA